MILLRVSNSFTQTILSNNGLPHWTLLEVNLSIAEEAVERSVTVKRMIAMTQLLDLPYAWTSIFLLILHWISPSDFLWNFALFHLDLTSNTGLVEADQTKIEKLGGLDGALSRFALGITSLGIVYEVKLANLVLIRVMHLAWKMVPLLVRSPFNITRQMLENNEKGSMNWNSLKVKYLNLKIS